MPIASQSANNILMKKALTSFADIREAAKLAGRKTIAVAGAGQEASIKAVMAVCEAGYADAIFCGERKQVEKIIEQNQKKDTAYEIIDCKTAEEAASTAIALLKEGAAKTLLKGDVPTSMLLRKALAKENNLRIGRVLSDINIIANPAAGGPPLIGVTDGGISVLPDKEQKIEIIKNAVEVFFSLGYERVKVALLSAVEKPTPALQSTIDAEEITRLSQEGFFGEAVNVFGPLALDNAAFKWCAETKGIQNEVAGNADIFIAPNLEAGNMLAKALTFYMRAEHGQMVFGLKAPVLIPSRCDGALARLNSLALAFVVSERIFGL